MLEKRRTNDVRYRKGIIKIYLYSLANNMMDLRKLKSGRKAHHFDLEQVKQFIDETGGKPAVVARRLGVCAVTLYRYIEMDHPELKEYIDDARRHTDQARVDMGEYVEETLLDKLESDPRSAHAAARTILLENEAARKRGWGRADNSDDTSISDADKIGFVKVQAEK
jgi:hypothetical protein